MNDIKMIVTDYDGTFSPRGLSGSWEVDNPASILEAKSAGIPIYVSTGRAWPQIIEPIKMYGFGGFCIASNGASITEVSTGNILYKKALPPESLLPMLQIGKKYDVVMQVAHTHKVGIIETKDPERSNKAFERQTMLHKATGYLPYLCKTPEEAVKVSKERADNDDHADMIMFLADSPEVIDPNLVSELKAIPGVEIIQTFISHVSAMASGVDKGAALVKLAEICNIDLKNVMAIGDEENDMGMIKIAGVGVAMGNARQDVKDAADYVTDLPENGGFAKAVRRFALGMDI